MARWQIRADAEIREYSAAALDIVQSEALFVNNLHNVIIRRCPKVT